MMNNEIKQIENLYQASTLESSEVKDFSIEEKRATASRRKKVIKAVINHSMWIYFILMSLNTVALVSFSKKII